MIKKLLSLSENLFTKTAFLTFAFRSKCRVNKSTSCKKKPRENQYSSSSRKKNQEKANNSPSYRCAAIKQKMSQHPANNANKMMSIMTNTCPLNITVFKIIQGLFTNDKKNLFQRLFVTISFLDLQDRLVFLNTRNYNFKTL